MDVSRPRLPIEFRPARDGAPGSSPELAAEKSIDNLDSVRVSSPRGQERGQSSGHPKMPARNLNIGSWFTGLGAIIVGLMGIISFRNRGAGAKP
jgi:hypothetical protein